ncbi:MAG: tRNA preQ1(34) S-adenosylmethionine ribosyltransferase-isomerase QueA [Armatimonadetes bacterium]|nr:tRNA preQ1(34) S-adenosylmethionine ribosyltransferase-isomerase QueA [Armatimonadota bacterium]
MRLSDFDYDLPPELIAQHPLTPRDASRLLVLHRESGRIEHRTFRDLPEYLRPGDLLVLNNSRVLPARVYGRKPTGGAVELLFLRRVAPGQWEALCSPGRRLPPGSIVLLGEGEADRLEIGERTEAGGRIVHFPSAEAELDLLERYGSMPLPPYIKAALEDPERYQTIYSRERGSAAAPTAGLHFTPELMDRIRGMGVEIAEVTLHVGLDTFRPIKEENLDAHRMHAEVCEISPEAAETINARKGRLLAVGTTSVRTLESMAGEDGQVQSGQEETRLFITPGYRFKAVDAMLTNFHLPKSTLVVLVSAFAGRERILEAYREAVEERYRFFSFGDAMLLL